MRTWTERRLENGVRAAVEVNGTGCPSYCVRWNVGSGHEAAHEHGIAHLVEHLTFCSMGGSFDDALAQLGAFGNATTEVESTAYYGSVPDGDLTDVLALEAARMQELQAHESQWKREIQVIAEEAEMLSGDQEHRWLEDLAQTLFAERDPYHHPIMGPVDRLPSLAQARSFHRRHYSALRCTVALAGAVETEPAWQCLQTAFGELPVGRPAPVLGPPEWSGEPRTADLRATDGVGRLYLVWRAAPWGTPGFWAQAVWGSMIAAGGQARLASIAVEGAPLTDYGYELLRWRRSPLLVVWAEAEGRDVGRLEHVLREALTNMPAPSAGEMERGRRIEATAEARGAEDSCDRALLKADALAHQLAEEHALFVPSRVSRERVVQAADVTRGPALATLRYRAA
jgi:predicted Zn-dependent peptidase